LAFEIDHASASLDQRLKRLAIADGNKAFAANGKAFGDRTLDIGGEYPTVHKNRCLLVCRSGRHDGKQ
jgi:hypothetical protein